MEEEIRKLRLLRSGDERTVNEVHSAFFSLILKKVLSSGGDREMANEIVNDAILILIKKAHRPDFELTAKITTLLYGIGSKLLLKKLKNRGRKNKNEILVDPTNDGGIMTNRPDEVKDSADHPKQLKLQQAIQKLDEICREILLKTIVGRIPHAEIAEMFGYKVDFIKVKKRRCREKLLNIIHGK